MEFEKRAGIRPGVSITSRILSLWEEDIGRYAQIHAAGMRRDSDNSANMDLGSSFVTRRVEG